MRRPEREGMDELGRESQPRSASPTPEFIGKYRCQLMRMNRLKSSKRFGIVERVSNEVEARATEQEIINLSTFSSKIMENTSHTITNIQHLKDNVGLQRSSPSTLSAPWAIDQRWSQIKSQICIRPQQTMSAYWHSSITPVTTPLSTGLYNPCRSHTSNTTDLSFQPFCHYQ